MDEWDALHWDDRAVYLAGLAEVWQARVGGQPVASSSGAATMNDEPQGLELFQQLGGQVTTEEVSPG